MSYAFSSTPSRDEGAHVPYVRAVRAHPFHVAIIVIAALALAIFWQNSRSPTYEATAQVLVTPVPEESPYTGLPAIVTSSSADPSRTMQTATSIFESHVAALTASRLGGGWTRGKVASDVSIQPRGESNVLSVTAKTSNATQAAALASAYARAALAQHAKVLGNEARLQIEQLRARARSLTPAEAAESSQIGSQLAALNTVAAGHDPNFSLLQTPTPPTSPSGTSKSVFIVLALLVGLIIGVGMAVITDYVNRRARDEDEILSLYPLPVLARVPLLPRSARKIASPELLPAGVREAFRTLQPQLPQTRESGGRAIMFTSASPGDGKTSAAVNFAFVLAAAGFRVILFDFDLRRPDVGRRLGVRSDFMELFRSEAQLDDLLKEVPTASGLRVVSSESGGETTPLVEAVVRRLPALLRRARELADYVIVDTPPLGQISDGLRAAMNVDDIVLVARPGNTDRVELQHTRELLDRMDHTPSGLVLIGDQTISDAYAVYGVGSTSRPGDEDDDEFEFELDDEERASASRRPRREGADRSRRSNGGERRSRASEQPDDAQRGGRARPAAEQTAGDRAGHGSHSHD
ncbi:MAG TPA: P-loop NTPase [Solirubrobacteraceae bacterium]|nr:P-loop NTPase [Solirubrobacteraceae bacterium]